MSLSYTAEERRELISRLEAGEPIPCPVCGQPVSLRPLPPARRVSYVRHRIMLICSGCQRAAALDSPGREAGGC